MTDRSNFKEETWVDPELEVDPEAEPGVRMMNRRGKVVEVHPAQVPAKLAQGWEIAVT